MYYKHLNFKVNFLLKNEEVLQGASHHCKLSILELNPEFIKLVESKNLSIGSIEIFKLEPSIKKWPIHVDGPVLSDFPKMNFVFGNKESPMIWYRVKDNIDKVPVTTSTNTPYLDYIDDEVEEIDRCLIKNASIIQAGIPHTVLHVGNETRWVVTIVFLRVFKTLTFDELVDTFKEFVD